MSQYQIERHLDNQFDENYIEKQNSTKNNRDTINLEVIDLNDKEIES